MSSTQLARTVVDGKLVTFHVPVLPISGYICGMDDFHWMVVTPQGKLFLVHKASASVIQISDQTTYEDESEHDSLDGIVGPFRRFVEAEFFGRACAPATALENVS